MRVMKKSNRPRGENLNDPARKRTSCHRCANVRKDVIACSSGDCNYVYCKKCKEKVTAEFGAEAFENGCPRCKGLCCCFNKSYNCTHIWHCYKKCPTTFGAREMPKKRKVGSVEYFPPPKSLAHPTTGLTQVTPEQFICHPTSDSYSSSTTSASVFASSSICSFGSISPRENMLATPSSVGQLLLVAGALEDEVRSCEGETEVFMTAASFSPAVSHVEESQFSPSPRGSSHHGAVTPAGHHSSSLAAATDDNPFDHVLTYSTVAAQSQNISSEYPFQTPDGAHPSSMIGHSFTGVQGEAGRTITADLSPIDITGLTWTSDNDAQDDGEVRTKSR